MHGCYVSGDSWEDPGHERGGREGTKDSESPNYSYFPLPAKITDGASYKHAGSVLLEAKKNQPITFVPLGR